MSLVAADEAAAMHEDEDRLGTGRFCRPEDVEAMALVRAIGGVADHLHAGVGLGLLAVEIERPRSLQGGEDVPPEAADPVGVGDGGGHGVSRLFGYLEV